jgi:methionyl-tRNA synthetase
MDASVNQKPFYLTTAIDYSNGLPHPGHALEKIGADAIVRFKRLQGIPVHFVMGMDEHGQKVAQSAAAAGVEPREWTDRIATAWQASWRSLSISYDHFIRTTEPRHVPAVHEMIRRMTAKGDIYRGKYAGFYCVGCEAYKDEDELVGGRCPEHPTREIEWMEEDDWFFRLSAYQEPLLKLLDRQPAFVRPESRRNEVRRMIEDIKDISVSRSGLAWGIRWPDDPEQVVYVWIDALTNYLTAVGFPDSRYTETWPADLHVIGKDIIRFHTIYWPAMLMSADIELPGAVWAHGWMTMGGGKISKSEGVSFTLADAVDRYGADAFRYFVLREVPWDGDGSFTWERFDQRYASDLANDLGNLANRTIAMLHRYREGRVPSGESTSLDQAAKEVIRRYFERMERYSLHEAAAAAFQLVSEANSFVETSAPWKLAKDPQRAGELDTTLAALVRALGVTAVLLSPFMPLKMTELWGLLGSGRPLANLAEIETLDATGWTVQKGAVLFPKPEVPSGSA